MSQILVADIFGRTEALEKLASELSGDIEIFDPYNSERINFCSEEEAYTYFSSEVGLDVYTKQLSDRIKKLSRPTSLLGFSVGASAIWQLSNNPDLEVISDAILFYSSQIRYHAEITPLFPIQLIFPTTEKHFSVPKLISLLTQKHNVKIHRSEFLHGFMNTHSQNYDQIGYDQYMQILRNS